MTGVVENVYIFDVSIPKATYVGREAAVLRALTDIALTNGMASDERSPTRPSWCVTGIVHIVVETSANLVDENEWHYCRKTLGLRMNKGPTGKVMSNYILSFEEADVKKAKEVIEKRRLKKEEDAQRTREWTEYLTQPKPNIAEKIYNRISVLESAPVIRALATLPMEVLEQVQSVLTKEEDALYEKIVAGSEKA